MYVWVYVVCCDDSECYDRLKRDDEDDDDEDDDEDDEDEE